MEKERERNMGVREKHSFIASCSHPKWGTKPATQACALTGDLSGDLLLCGTMPNQLSQTGQGPHVGFFFLNKEIVNIHWIWLARNILISKL